MKKERPLEKPERENLDVERLRGVLLSDVEKDIVKTKVRIDISTSDNEREYHTIHLQDLYKLKLSYYGK